MNAQADGAQTRALAARVVDAVLHDGRTLDSALESAALSQLTARDRAMVQSLAYGTLRSHWRNTAVVRQLARKPFRSQDHLLLALLSVGLHALTDSRAPDYAVVSATVSASAQLGLERRRGFINALLRRFLREREVLLAAADADPVARWQHPDWLLAALRADWPDHWQAIVVANASQPPMWLRVNRLHQGCADYAARLQAAGIAASAPVDALPAALQLALPVAVQELPGFAAGDCSVQDAASQFAALLLDVQPGMRVLDACAAPGGKTAHLLEQTPGITLLAVDQSAQRLERVRQNLDRLGLVAALRTADAAATDDWWDGQLYDRILLDAPCSATGVIRRHPDILHLRRPADIAGFEQQQWRLLQALWLLLRPGGRLLYATCSVLRAENEAVIDRFLQAAPDARDVTPQDRVPPCLTGNVKHGVQLLPGAGNTDGFYYALMERTPARELHGHD